LIDNQSIRKFTNRLVNGNSRRRLLQVGTE